eukprot:3640484-Lingulodinium_polyedra.AAC.1
MLGAVNLDWRTAARRVVAQVCSAAGPAQPANPDDDAAEADELRCLGSRTEEAGADPPLPPPPLGHTP